MTTPPKAKILSIRGVDDLDARDFSSSAAVRGMTQAEYLHELIALHQMVRRWNWASADDLPNEPAALYFIDGNDDEYDYNKDAIHELGAWMEYHRMQAYLA